MATSASSRLCANPLGTGGEDPCAGIEHRDLEDTEKRDRSAGSRPGDPSSAEERVAAGRVRSRAGGRRPERMRPGRQSHRSRSNRLDSLDYPRAPHSDHAPRLVLYRGKRDVPASEWSRQHIDRFENLAFHDLLHLVVQDGQICPILAV